MAVPASPKKFHLPRLEPSEASWSPPRSPRRRAQFAIRELDPLLSNLSPDSTLKALQATLTIPGGTAQDALTASIADVSPSEREVGIRAAFAAQKLREWKSELSQWQWPAKHERQLGLGFVPPPSAEQNNQTAYRGSLTVELAERYEDRLEEIKEDLDNLGLEGIKDHVLEAHGPAHSQPKSTRPTSMGTSLSTSYGRMRDFTALITATVIQALPDLATVNMHLDAWEVRLRVLRHLAPFHDVMNSCKLGIQDAYAEIRDPVRSCNVSNASVDAIRTRLGAQVSDVGRRVDRMLDLLEGQQDSLPQTWIDQLEKVELDYATWVVEAGHVALRNALALLIPQPTTIPPTLAAAAVSDSGQIRDPAADPEQANSKQLDADADLHVLQSETTTLVPEAASNEQPVQQPIIFNQPWVPDGVAKEHGVPVPLPPPPPPEDSDEQYLHPKQRKPSLKIDLPPPRSHRRDPSRASFAESQASAFSDISNAEIIEATTTTVRVSPKIQMVETDRQAPEEFTWFGGNGSAHLDSDRRPPILQRASTTSIEVVPKDLVKTVMLRRTASWDMLVDMPQSPESTPSKALKQLIGKDSPLTPPAEESADPDTLKARAEPTGITKLDTSPLKNGPPPLHSRATSEGSPPVLPRRSSKRNTIGTFSPASPASTTLLKDPVTPKSAASPSSPKKDPVTPRPTVDQHSPKKPAESLEDRIQDILTTLPTKIRLAKDADTSSSASNSTVPTRASTPTPSLTLSPVKHESTSRRSSANDPEVRLYHLTRSGAARDAPPVKLFVRTVGGSNRVMVRVGGGWADLAEYLREYSLHHGSRTGTDGRLEVASFPDGSHRNSTGSLGNGAEPRRKSRSPTVAQGYFDNMPPELSIPKSRKSTTDATWTPPPVPQIPASYMSKSPTVTTTTKPNTPPTVSVTQALSPETPSTGGHSHTVHTPNTTTTTTVVTPVSASTTTSHSSYTPLGAAGPKPARRSATYSIMPPQDDWVNNIVGKARAVSGSGPHTNVATQTNQQGHNVTTTTTVSSGGAATPPQRRRSIYFGLGGSPRAASSLGVRSTTAAKEADGAAADADGTAAVKRSRRASMMGGKPADGSPRSKELEHSPNGRPKSRMSLGDIGGIKRVFLRKKTGEVK